MTEMAIRSNLKLQTREFNLFRNLIFSLSGIKLNDSKKELFRARLQKRVRNLGLESYKEYYDLVVKDKSGNELTVLLDSISTNVTSFFREIKHFNFLDEVLLPELIQKKGQNNLEARVWSAACSSGEEPYSIVFNFLKNKNFNPTCKIKVLATDLSTAALSQAQKGFYPSDRVEDSVPKTLIRKYFERGGHEYPDYCLIKREVRDMVLFKRFNLMTPKFPFKNKFDCVFIRNVMIYFDTPTREELINKIYDFIEDGGYLFIGHSESLSSIKHKFNYVQPTIYKKL